MIATKQLKKAHLSCPVVEQHYSCSAILFVFGLFSPTRAKNEKGEKNFLIAKKYESTWYLPGKRDPTLFFFFCNTQEGEWERALALFEEMQQAPAEDNIAPNQFTYNALIGVFTYTGRLDLATEKFKEMVEVSAFY